MNRRGVIGAGGVDGRAGTSSGNSGMSVSLSRSALMPRPRWALSRETARPGRILRGGAQSWGMDRVHAALRHGRLRTALRLWTLCALCLLVPPSAAAGRSSPPRALLGSTGVSRAVLSVPAGTAEAVRVRAASGGVLRSLDLYLAGGERARRVLVGIYDGRSGALLAAGAFVRPRARGWYSDAVHATRIVAHRTYWLAALAVGGPLRVRAGTR